MTAQEFLWGAQVRWHHLRRRAEWWPYRRKHRAGQLPSQRELCLLFDMMHHAFVETRALGHGGRAEQAAHLGGAFHNLPLQLGRCFSDGAAFDWVDLRERLTWYQEKYSREAESYFDYLAMLNLVDVPRR